MPVGAAQLRDIATYADGIGPSLKLILRGIGTDNLSALVTQAHALGLVVHPYTFRADDLPAGIDEFDGLLDLFIRDLRVDGLFTDFPDRVVRRRRARAS